MYKILECVTYMLAWCFSNSTQLMLQWETFETLVAADMYNPFCSSEHVRTCSVLRR